MQATTKAARPAAQHDDQALPLIGGGSFDTRTPWRLPERRAMHAESGFGPLDAHIARGVLAQEAAIRAEAHAAQHRRISATLQAELGGSL